MKILSIYLFVALFVAVARCSLLEMSQLLWSKLLEGGIAKIGALDPLRVPVVKIDQSEGNTTYRLVLRNVQVFGLNGSALESVRFARGKHMNNYSDSESGYVNYSDLRDVEAVQYRFHSPGNNKNSDGDHAAEGRDEYSAKYSAPQQYNNNNEQQQRQPSQYQDERYQRVQQAPDQYARQEQGVKGRHRTSGQVDDFYSNPHRGQGGSGSSRQDEHRPVYSGSAKGQQSPSEDNLKGEYAPSRSTYAPSRVQPLEDPERQYQPTSTRPQYRQEDTIKGQYSPSRGTYSPSEHKEPQYRPRQYETTPAYSEFKEPSRTDDYGRSPYQPNPQRNDNRKSYQSGSVRSDDERRPYQSDPQRNDDERRRLGLAYSAPGQAPSMTRGSYEVQFSANRPTYQGEKVPLPSSERLSSDTREDRRKIPVGVHVVYAQRAKPEQFKSDNPSDDQCQGNCQRRYSAYEGKTSAEEADPDVAASNKQFTKEEKPSDYIDIFYSDGKDDMKHFGNYQLEGKKQTKVYGLEDVMRDLNANRRYIIHNFTTGESLLKKNDKFRTAYETKRLRDLIRYAKEYQEKNGYFEEGMQLIYHYGNESNYDVESIKPVNANDAKRRKRQHDDSGDDQDDENIMNAVLRIRVPSLTVRANYALMGKVDKQILRGNGFFIGNFTDLIGDFTLELKRVDEKTLAVRAAKAKLTVGSKSINLEGMDDKGPVKSILSHGVMAAEAVAAMLADDLATKALSEKAADSVIYKMFNNSPAN